MGILGLYTPCNDLGLGYYIGKVDILLKMSLNKFQADPCRINTCAGSLV